MAEKRVAVIKCSGNCRYLRINQDPFDNEEGWYCAYNPHSAWERITEKDCKGCDREARFAGITKKEFIDKIEKALKDAVTDDEVATDHHLAVCVAKALLDE